MDEGIVQTTNQKGNENCSGKHNLQTPVQFRPPQQVKEKLCLAPSFSFTLAARRPELLLCNKRAEASAVPCTSRWRVHGCDARNQFLSPSKSVQYRRPYSARKASKNHESGFCVFSIYNVFPVRFRLSYSALFRVAITSKSI